MHHPLLHQPSMKLSNLIFFALALVTLHARAESFVISDGETNSIAVAANEAIVVDFIDSNSPFPILRREKKASVLVSITKGSGFAGPCELVFFRSTLVTFRRIQTAAMTTVVLGANETNTVVVPADRTLKIFTTDGQGKVVVSRGAHSRTVLVGLTLRHQLSGLELTGPLTVMMTGHSSSFLEYEYGQVYSYYFTDDFVQITADGYLRGPTGTFEILVEKSTDLSHWLPVMVQNTASADSSAFFRLRIHK